ncbi:MAG: dienelactone hydrolase family protein [Actinomycetota bacterium]
MIEQTLSVATGDGAMATFIVHPERGEPSPVVLFLMDAPGMREELRNMARRLASAGYYVMCGQLYYREVDHFNVFETGDRDRMFELMSGLSNAMVTSDCRSLISVAADDPAADADRVGTVGYCMSGPMALMAAAAMPNTVRAAASIHGVRLAVDADDSPHRHLDQITGEVYVACAETDEYAPTEMVDAFSAALDASGTAGEVEWYPGTHHGFAFAERDWYDRDASERHWERLHDLFRRRLHSHPVQA